MKKIVQIIPYDIESLESHGFKTEQQKRSVTVVADLLEEIRNASGSFGILAMFISDKDLFDNRPVTVWSNLTDADKRLMVEDYILKRLKMLETSRVS